MTKRIRKLLGYLLIACLLLSGVSALAETGTIAFTVPKDEEKGFTNLKDIEFEIYRVAEPTGVHTAWGPTKGFEILAPEFAEDNKTEWTTEEVNAMVGKIEQVLNGETPVAPCVVPNKKTDETGKIVYDGLEAGIYYIRKNAASRPKIWSPEGNR